MGERLEVIEDLECVQVGNVDCVDERLEEDVECMHVGDDDFICIPDVDLQGYRDEDKRDEIVFQGAKDEDRTDVVGGCRKVLEQKERDVIEAMEF